MHREAKKETFLIQRELFAEGKSSIQKYQDLMVGRRGWVRLFKYEAILLLASWVPGAIGLFLRGKLYPLLLGGAGRGVIFGRSVVLRHPHKIHLGDRTVVDDNCVLDAKGTENKGIFIGNDVFLGRNTILSCKDGDIYIDDHVNIGFNCLVFSANIVRLGKHIQIAAYSYLNGGSHSFERTDVPVSEQERSGKGISIADNVWLAANVKVLDGVEIGRDAIIGAGAVVTKDVPPFCIAAGVPAQVVKQRAGTTNPVPR